MDTLSLEKFLREQMPLAKSMDVHVLRVDPDIVELGCSLQSNHNHLGTAFGGSLGALMILAAYCRLFQLMDRKGHVLLKSSTMKFMRPVAEDLKAGCLPPPAKESQEFLTTYLNKGRAKLSLTSEIVLRDGTVASRMIAEFVGRL
jgi:thioesterase domain-containing protein